jgi:hypothetical protein
MQLTRVNFAQYRISPLERTVSLSICPWLSKSRGQMVSSNLWCGQYKVVTCTYLLDYLPRFSITIWILDLSYQVVRITDSRPGRSKILFTSMARVGQKDGISRIIARDKPSESLRRRFNQPSDGDHRQGSPPPSYWHR